VETRELLEHVEETEQATERREEFGRHAAVLVSVMAALLAIASLAGTRASTEAILSQEKASDTYNEYQANSLKRHINLDDATALRILAANGPTAEQANTQAESLEQAVATKYQPAQDDLLPRAQALEHERDLAESRHRGFQSAEAAEVALALVDRALGDLIDAESARYAAVCDALSAHQRAVLVALARETGAVYSERYRRTNKLGSAGSVRSSLGRLADRELVDSNGGYAISDVFLREWIRRLR
jgi:hypothetical protein